MEWQFDCPFHFPFALIRDRVFLLLCHFYPCSKSFQVPLEQFQGTYFLAQLSCIVRVSLTFYRWLRYLFRGIFDATLGRNFTQILDSIMDLRVWVWNHRCVISRFSTGLGTGKNEGNLIFHLMTKQSQI